MGCICSKGSNADDFVVDYENAKVVAPSKTQEIIVGVVYDESAHTISKPVLQANMRSASSKHQDEEDHKTRIVERPTSGHHQRRVTLESFSSQGQPTIIMSRIISLPRATQGEQIAAGWPSWLTAVAGEAIQGWLLLCANSFEKLNEASSYFF